MHSAKATTQGIAIYVESLLWLIKPLNTVMTVKNANKKMPAFKAFPPTEYFWYSHANLTPTPKTIKIQMQNCV